MFPSVRHYFVKKPGAVDWDPFSTESLATSPKRRHIGLDWRIRKEGQATDHTVAELLALEQQSEVVPQDDAQKYSGRCYYVHKGETEIGPLSHADMQARIDAKEFLIADLVWFEGLGREWKPLETLAEFSFNPETAPQSQRTEGSRQYYVHKNDQELGPLWQKEVHGGIDTRQFSRNDRVWFQGLEDWAPISTLPDFPSLTYHHRFPAPLLSRRPFVFRESGFSLNNLKSLLDDTCRLFDSAAERLRIKAVYPFTCESDLLRLIHDLHEHQST